MPSDTPTTEFPNPVSTKARHRPALPLLTIFASLPLAGQALAQPEDEIQPARPTLIAESTALVAGATNSIALAFEIEKGWHTYWPGQNDTGFAPAIELTLPDGWTAGEPEWPTPHRHISPGDILDHTYEGTESTIIIPISIPADATTGPATITAAVEWLVCREACIPGWETVALDTSVIPQTARPKPSEHAPRFKAARDRMPVPYPPTFQSLSDATPPAMLTTWEDGTLIIKANPSYTKAKPSAIAFYPTETGATIADLLTTGQSTAAKPGAAPPPLRLRRLDATKPYRGIVEVFFDPKTPSKIYAIDTRSPDDPGAHTPKD